MIVAQGLGLSFNGFLKAAALPALASLAIVWAVVAYLYRGRWQSGQAPASAIDSSTSIEFNHWETGKAIVVTVGVVAAFVFSPWPREIIALTAAGLLLLNRSISSSDMLKDVDGNLLLLIIGLFVVNAALANTGLPQTLLTDFRAAGVNIEQPMTLYVIGGIIGNLVGNNPAVMLLMPFLHPDAASDALGAALALGTGLSSNLIVFGSLAGIILVDQAAAHGVKISFAEFSRAGIPVTIATMIVGAAWIAYLS